MVAKEFEKSGDYVYVSQIANEEHAHNLTALKMDTKFHNQHL